MRSIQRSKTYTPMIDERFLNLGKNDSGDIWMCGHCDKPAEHVRGSQDKEDLAYTLMCPAKALKLGEWPDLETKSSELAAYKHRLILASEDLTQA
ncbi:MAG: hypothetical protein JOZ14_14145 [Acidobacteria bacterium]|nr:hypothetical protein [Acidobacteriota bacterium]